MMKRVCKTRVGVCAMLLAVFLLVGGVGAPVFAREDMSIGQAGDPGDGLDRDGGGGDNLSPIGEDNTTARPSNDRSSVSVKTLFILIPIYDATGLHYVAVFNFAQLAAILK